MTPLSPPLTNEGSVMFIFFGHLRSSSTFLPPQKFNNAFGPENDQKPNDLNQMIRITMQIFQQLLDQDSGEETTSTGTRSGAVTVKCQTCAKEFGKVRAS